MRRFSLIGIFIVAAACSCAAQTDLARVREVIHLPHISVQFKIEFDLPRNKNIGATPVRDSDSTARIADLQKLLHGRPSDAAIYVQIADSYVVNAPGSSVKIADAYNSAISLFRKQLEKSPRDGWVVSQLGDALWSVNTPDESEKWLRQAVREAPNDWRCWANLGDYIQVTSLTRVLDNDKIGLASYTDIAQLERLLEPLGKKQGLDKAVEGFAASQKEARDAYEKAVALAPTVAEPYDRRFTYRMFDQLWAQNILRVGRGEQPVYSLTSADSALNDEWTAAELSPDDVSLQYRSLIYEIRFHTEKLSSDQPNDLHTGLSKLSPDRRDKVTHGLARLAKCADSPDRVRSASALVALASVYFLLSDIDDASTAVVRAASLDPNNQQAAKAVVAAYLAGKKYTLLASVLQDQIKHQDSPYKRLCLAHVYGALGNHEGVSEQILTGLKLFPDDLLLNLAMADGLMKVKDADSLGQAGEVISRAQILFDKLPAKEQQANQANFDVTRGIYLALIGKPDVARLALQRVLNNDPDNEEAKEVMIALGGQ